MTDQSEQSDQSGQTATVPYFNDAAAFDQHIAAADKPVLVDFTAAWCGPCKALAPILDDIATSVDDFTIIKVDADENAETTGKLGVQGLPTLVLFEDGEELIRITGALGKADLLAKLEPFI